MEHHIAQDLIPLATPIADLKPLPGNPRRGDVDAVALSYDTFGQRKPVIALADGTVIAGNHQLAAAKKLGWTHLAVVRVDDDPTTAKAFALADNRTAELGTYDEQALLDMLQEVATDDALLDATGWEPHHLKDLEALLQTPSLDDLEAEHGDDGDTDEAFWPTVRFNAPPHLVTIWNETVTTAGGKPEVALAKILGADLEPPDLSSLV